MDWFKAAVPAGFRISLWDGYFDFWAVSSMLVFRGFGPNGGDEADQRRGKAGTDKTFPQSLERWIALLGLKFTKGLHVFSILVNYCSRGPCPDHHIEWRIQFPS